MVYLILKSRFWWLLAALFLTACQPFEEGGGGKAESSACDAEVVDDVLPEDFAVSTVEDLGNKLFHDKNLSLNKTQSCATCHAPSRAFIDPRQHLIACETDAASLGDDKVSIGDRNAPTAGYAAFSPDFNADLTRQRHSKAKNHQVYDGALGGQFLDGREADLKGQAGGPPLNPLEMGMADKASVVSRIKEDEVYVEKFKEYFGDDIFNDDTLAYAAMTQAIGKFEKTEQFAPFDSKYDRYLAGEIDLMSPLSKAALGKSVFFSQFANCAMCHQLQPDGHRAEPFTAYEYHNLGVPENTVLRSYNGVTEKDTGLQLNPEFKDDDTAKGKFKTSTLRNIAVTGPYMHNGVFKDLKTVILFYDHYVNDERVNNPETGEPWRAPEVSDNLAEELTAANALTDKEVEGLECFMRLLTDAQFEHLLPTHRSDGSEIVCD